MNIVNDRRPVCDICNNIDIENSSIQKADIVLSIRPIISQSGGDNISEIYLCNRHQRLLLKTFDNVIESKKDKKR
jgi:hypothetical protein